MLKNVNRSAKAWWNSVLLKKLLNYRYIKSELGGLYGERLFEGLIHLLMHYAIHISFIMQINFVLISDFLNCDFKKIIITITNPVWDINCFYI